MHILVDKLLLHGEHLNLAFFASSFFDLRYLSFVFLFLFGGLKRLFDDLLGINHLRLNDIICRVVECPTVGETAEIEIQG